jgi:hypothetical protein
MRKICRGAERYININTKEANGDTNMFDRLKIQYKMAKMTVEALVNKFESDQKAEAPIKALFMLFILAVLAGALVPTAIASLKAANTTSWTTSEIATYGIITIMVLIAVVMLIARIATE